MNDLDRIKIAKELIRVVKALNDNVIQLNPDYAIKRKKEEETMSRNEILSVMKKLKKGDKVEVGYFNSQKGGRTQSKYTVEMGVKEYKEETGISKATVQIKSRGDSRGWGGSIMDYGNKIMFQPTMNTNIKEVLSLKKI